MKKFHCYIKRYFYIIFIIKIKFITLTKYENIYKKI